MKNQKMRGNKGKIVIAAICFILVFALAVTALAYWDSVNGKYKGENNPAAAEVAVSIDGVDYVFRDDIETLLIMGLDKTADNLSAESYNNNQQADFLMLLVIDKKNKSYTPLHINRDTMVEMPVLGVTGEEIGTREGQIALSHTYGSGGKDSCINTRKTVSSFLMDAPIDNYISLTMDAVKTVNDAVGGVEVTVLDDFTGIDDTLRKGETVTLMGDTALTYVRTRYGMEDSSNEQRMQRQQQYLAALKKRFDKHSAQEGFTSDTLLKINDYMVSSCSITKLDGLMDTISEYNMNDVRVIEGEIEIGEYKEFYADGVSLTQTVADLFCEKIQ